MEENNGEKVGQKLVRADGCVICFVIYWLKKGKSLIIIKYICNKIKTVFQ